MKETILGISISWLLWLAIIALAIIGGTAFTIWYNLHLAVPLENSQRHVMTCTQQYLVTQETKIGNDLKAIRNSNLEIADPNYASLKPQLQAQNQQNADDIYGTLDHSQCSRPQIIADMPELQSFFSQFPNR